MFSKNNLRRFLGILFFPIAYLLTNLLVHNVYSLVISFLSVYRVDPRRSVRPTDIGFIFAFLLDEVEAMYRQLYNHGLAATLTAFTVLVIVIVISRKEVNFKWMIFDRLTTTSGALLCAALGAGIGILQGGVIVAARTQAAGFTFLDTFNGSVGNAAFWIIAVVIFIPFAQEVVFRGIALYRGLRIFTPATAIVIQAILFAIVTLDPLQGIFSFILGLVLGYIYWKTGSIWASFIANAAHALAFILGFNLLINAAGAFVLIMIAASILAGVVLFLLYRQIKAEA